MLCTSVFVSHVCDSAWHRVTASESWGRLWTFCRLQKCFSWKYVQGAASPHKGLATNDKEKMQCLAWSFTNTPCDVYEVLAAVCHLILFTLTVTVLKRRMALGDWHIDIYFNDAWFSSGERGRGRPQQQLRMSSLHAGFQQPWEAHLPCLPGQNSAV